MKWISHYLKDEAISITTAEELDLIEEQLGLAHRLIKHIGSHTWEDEHRLACEAFIARYPEPEEDKDV